MNTHAALSPSKRHRWALCPGSIREEAKYPEQRESPAAIDGTHSHTLLEHCIKTGLIDPMTTVGLTMRDHDGEFTVDRERAARVKIAVDYVQSRLVETLGLGRVTSEMKVDPSWLMHRKDLGGTVDIQIFDPMNSVLEIIDYKDGMAPVKVQGNHQLELYAIGVISMLEIPVNKPFPFHTVRMTIIQPKLTMRGINPIQSHDVGIDYLLHEVVPKIAVEATLTERPDAALVPGESQCNYCRAKGGCSALASNVMKEVGIMFPQTIQPVEIVDQTQNDPATMNADQIRQILEAAPMLRQMIEAVEKEALRRLEAGQSLPGLKLVHGRGSRAWALSEEEMAEKLIKMGIPKGAVYESKLISPAKAEKLTWTKRDGSVVQLSKKQIDRMDQEYVAKVAGKLTVVPESDSRPAAPIANAAPMFAAVSSNDDQVPAWLV